MLFAGIPGTPGAPRVFQHKEVHAQFHQVPLHGVCRHAAVHGVHQLGSLPARDTTQWLHYSQRWQWIVRLDNQIASIICPLKSSYPSYERLITKSNILILFYTLSIPMFLIMWSSVRSLLIWRWLDFTHTHTHFTWKSSTSCPKSHWPQPSVFVVGVVDDGPPRGELHAGHGGHRPGEHGVCIVEERRTKYK